MTTTDLEALREELRARAYADQNHVAIHLFEEADALREMVAELAAHQARILKAASDEDARLHKIINDWQHVARRHVGLYKGERDLRVRDKARAADLANVVQFIAAIHEDCCDASGYCIHETVRAKLGVDA